jgi:hypothetical protein
MKITQLTADGGGNSVLLHKHTWHLYMKSIFTHSSVSSEMVKLSLYKPGQGPKIPGG